MSQTVTLNGVSYTVPDPDDTGWGTYTTSYLTAIASNMLQKNGGSFALTNDADFGSTKGLIAAYFKSASSNIAGAGAVRLSNTDDIGFRNAGNDGDLLLSADAGTDGILTYNSVALATISATQTLTNKTLTSPVINTGISGTAIDDNTSLGSSATKVPTQNAVKSYVDAQLTASDLDFQGDSGGAQSVDLDSQSLTVEGGTGLDTTGSAQKISIAIDSTVATLTGTQTLTNKTINSPKINEDIALTATSTYLNRMDATSSVQTQLNAKQATITGAATTIASADLTASKALQSNASGKVEVSSVTTTELGYVSGVTSALQTQLNAKQATIDSSNRLDADLIHDGTVSNTEFGYINSLTSNAQTQLDAKAPISQPEFTSYVDFDSISAPGAPSDSGDVRLYANSSKLYFQGQGDGSPTEIGSGGGGGAGDADTIQLKAANSFDAVNTAPWYTGNNPVPGGGGSLGGTFELSTSNPLINTDDATKVFRYTNVTSNRKNDYFEIELDVPNYAKGHNLVVQLFYRTVGAEDTDFLFFARDRTADYETTTTTTGAVNTITLASATGFAVGDRICVQDSSDVRHFRYVTAVASSDITFSGSAITVGSGDVVVSKYFTDELNFITAENNTTNYEGKIRKWAFQINDTTTKIRVGFLYDNSATSTNELFFDQILLSSNQFLQTSSQGRSYSANYGSIAGYSSGNTAIPYYTTENYNNVPSEYATVTGTDSTNGFRIIANQAIRVEAFSALQADSGVSEHVAWSKGATASELDNPVYSLAGSKMMTPICKAESSTEVHNVGGSFVLEKGEIGYLHGDGSGWLTGNSNQTTNVVITPLVNDVVLLNSQDEIFTDWQPYTATFGGGVTVTNQQCFWRRNGDSLEIKGRAQLGSNPATNAAITIPSGLSIDTSKLPGNGTSDVYYQSAVHKVKNTVDYTGGGDNSSGMFHDTSAADNTTYIYVGYNYNAVSGNCIDVLTWNGYIASGDGIEFWCANIPISGWTSTFNPVLSMPLVDFGTFENTYSARIDNNGTASITSQSENFISSVNRTGTGVVAIVWQSGFFTQPPVVTATVESSGEIISQSSVATTSGVTLEIVNHASASNDRDFAIVVQRQGSDYRQPPQPTAAVIKPAVVYLKDEKAPGVNAISGTASAGWHDRLLTHISGESWFVTTSGSMGQTGDNTNFTLEAGTYEFSALCPQYHGLNSTAKLTNVTDSTVQIKGQSAYYNATNEVAGQTPIMGSFTITSSKEFKIEQYCGGAAYFGVGTGGSMGVPEVYTQATIRKLK